MNPDPVIPGASQSSSAGQTLPPPLSPLPLNYQTYDRLSQRPAVLTAMAIVSILLGVLALPLNLGIAGYMFMACARSIPPAAPPLPTPLAVPVLPAYTGELIRPGGLTRAARAGLLAKMPLDGLFVADRKLAVDRLLAEMGKRLAGDDKPSQLQPLRQPSAARAAAGAGADIWAADTLLVPGGVIVVDNTSATFRPSGTGAGAGDAIVVKGNTVQTAEGSRWSAVAIDQRIADLRSQLPKITPQQVAALVQRLDLSVIPPRPDAEVALCGCRFVEGNVLVATINGIGWLVLSDGTSITTTQAPYGLDLQRHAPRPAPRPQFRPYLPGSPMAMVANGLQSLAAATLAGLLLMAGVKMLGSRPTAALWHVRWATLKLTLCVIEIVLAAWLLSSMQNMSRSLGMVTYSAAARWVGLGIGAGLQCIYPAIILPVILCSKSIRQFDRHGGGALDAWWLSVRQWFRPRFVRTVILIALIVAAVLSALHLGLGMWFGYGEGAETISALSHVLVGGILLVISIAVFIRLARRPLAVAPLLLLVLAGLALPQKAFGEIPPPAPASAPASRPTTDRAADAALQARAAALLKRMRSSSTPQYYDLFREAVRLGEPVQLLILQDLIPNQLSDARKIAIVTEEWKKLGIVVSPRNLPEALKLLPQIGAAHRVESLQVLALYPRVPELVVGYAPLITEYSEDLRNAAIDRVMELDPTGKAAVDAVRQAMKTPSGGHDYRYYKPLQRIGAPAIPLLIELSQQPNVSTRMDALAAMQPLDGKSFRQQAADRAVDLYVDPVSDLTGSEHNLKQWAGLLRGEALKTLASMGPSGVALADDLRAGKRPVSAARRKMMQELDAPDELKKALFPQDPAASVPEAHWQAIQDLARLHKQGAQLAVEQAFTLMKDSPDAGIRLISARLLAASPEVGRQTDDLARLIAAAKTPEMEIRRTLASLLLGGHLAYSTDIRDLCFTWLNTRYDAQDQVIQMLAKLPLGRRALLESLAGTGWQYPCSGRVLDALIAVHPTLAALNTAHTIEPWTHTEFRVAVAQLVTAADADPAHVEQLLIKSALASDQQLVLAAATALSIDRYRSKLGLSLTGRLGDISPAWRYLPGSQPLVAAPSSYPMSWSAPTVAEAPADNPDLFHSLSSLTWTATAGLLLAVSLILCALLVVAPRYAPGHHRPL